MLTHVRNFIREIVQGQTERIVPDIAAHIAAVRQDSAHYAAEQAAGRQETHARIDELRREIGWLQSELAFVKNRQAVYLGQDVAMTWLPDESLVYVNSTDEGCPANFIGGGIYEEDNTQVLFSFFNPDGLMLDIGANLGVFSLRAAEWLNNARGRIMAFEPHPGVCALFRRSTYQNGYLARIDIRNVALSDQAGSVKLFYPAHHIGGGGHVVEGPNAVTVDAELQVLDDLIPTGTFDVAKIDVEGNELSVLRGMRKLIVRSPKAAILFEKLAPNSPIDRDLWTFFEDLGMSLFAIEGNAMLRPLDEAAFRAFGGYVTATRPKRLQGLLDRRFVDINWQILQFHDGKPSDLASPSRKVAAQPGAVLFNGPYWHLPRGRYRISIMGGRTGDLRLELSERFGRLVQTVELPEGAECAEFVTRYDLQKFEILARAGSAGPATVDLSSVRLQRF